MPPNAVPQRDAEALLRRAVRALKDGARLDLPVLRSAYRRRLSESGAVVFSLAAAILSARASAEAKSTDDAASTGFPAFPVADGMEDLLALSETCLEDDPYGLEAREPHDHDGLGGDHDRGHGGHGDGSYRDDPFACRFESPYAAGHGAGHGDAHGDHGFGGALASAHAHGAGGSAAHGGHERAGHSHGDHAGHAGHGASHAHRGEGGLQSHDGHGHADAHDDHAAGHEGDAAHAGGHAGMAGPHAHHHHAGHGDAAFHGGHGAEAAAHDGVEGHAAVHGSEGSANEEDAVLADAFAALEPAPAGTPGAHDHGAPAEEGGHSHGFEAALLPPPPAEAPPVEATPII